LATGVGGFALFVRPARLALRGNSQANSIAHAPPPIELRVTMTRHDDQIRIRPGRIRRGDRGVKRPRSFVGEVMRAAKKAGHTGKGFGRAGGNESRSTFGRGRRAALALSSRSPARRVMVMARGRSFSAAPLARHIAYLKREGVTRDGDEARLIEAASDSADGKAFAKRCAEDRHHFRFIVSPEDAAHVADLPAFTRELMNDAERDLGTKLDWVAVDHWNTDNPHVHVLVRGRADDGRDLVISRDYMSQGFRRRAAERVELELGPQTDWAIRAGLEKEVLAERWTSLDRAFQSPTRAQACSTFALAGVGRRTESFAPCSSPVQPGLNA
jgi:hypothetical protein